MSSKRRSIALIYGLITGLVLVGYILLLYRFGIGAYMGNAAYLRYLLLFGMAAAAALAEKKAGGGYLEFRDALKASFTVIVIALAMETATTYVLMNYIDIPFRQAVENEELKRTVAFMRRMKFPESQVNEAITSSKGVNQHTLPKALQGLAISFIAYFIAALLIAIIVKKKNKP